jgi:hypothetical protein
VPGIAAHVDACARCQAVVAELRAGAAQFDHVFARSAPALEARRSSRRVFVLAPLALAVAGVGIYLALPDAGDGTRSKGPGDGPAEAALEIYARRGEQLFPITAGQTLAPGDQLRFVAQRPPGLSYAMMVSLTADGRRVVYHPIGGEAAAALPGVARRLELPGAVTVDDRPGPETVVLLLDARPFTLSDVQPLLAELAAAKGTQRRAGPVAAVVSIPLERAGASPAR